MADLIKVAKKVSVSESPRVWDFDFTADLRTGITVSSATATHTPPSGSASSPAVGTIVSNVVPVSLGSLTVIGTHYLECLATLSNSEKSSVKIQFDVIY
jgi:hypothetical protein